MTKNEVKREQFDVSQRKIVWQVWTGDTCGQITLSLTCPQPPHQNKTSFLSSLSSSWCMTWAWSSPLLPDKVRVKEKDIIVVYDFYMCKRACWASEQKANLLVIITQQEEKNSEENGHIKQNTRSVFNKELLYFLSCWRAAEATDSISKLLLGSTLR